MEINKRQAAERLKVDIRTFTKMALESELPHIQRGKEKLYKIDDVDTLTDKMVGTPGIENKIYAITSPKGGTTKTSIVKHAASELSRRGKTVLVTDADPQHYFTTFALTGKNDEERKRSQKVNLLSLLTDETKLIKTTLPYSSGIDFIPGIRKLENYDRVLDGFTGRELRMKKALSPALSRYDYILIDTSPSQGAVTVAALFAAHVVIIPIIPDIDSFDAARDLLKSIVRILEGDLRENFKLSKIFIVPNRQKLGFMASAFHKQIYRDILDEFNLQHVLNIDIQITSPIMEWDNLPEESYRGVLKTDTKAYKNYAQVMQEIFNAN